TSASSNGLPHGLEQTGQHAKFSRHHTRLTGTTSSSPNTNASTSSPANASNGPTSNSTGFRHIDGRVRRIPVTAALTARASISCKAVKPSKPRATNLSTPRVNVSTPRVNVSTPRVNVSTPRVNVPTPGVNVPT